MGLLERLQNALSVDEQSGVEYQCASCGEVFDTSVQQCPSCGETDIRERGSFEFRPD